MKILIVIVKDLKNIIVNNEEKYDNAFVLL